MDKACLILFTDKPYTVFVIDSPNSETDYWSKEFVNISYKNDNVNNTNQFLSLTKSYITNQLPKETNVTKAEQIDLLNKSVEYFQKNENFQKRDFEKEVFQSQNSIDTFRNYELSYVSDKKIEIEDNFTISKQIVKKQSKSFKSVLKLDKSIDIYIHGNQSMIEKGIEEKSGRKFYKIFYDMEE